MKIKIQPSTMAILLLTNSISALATTVVTQETGEVKGLAPTVNNVQVKDQANPTSPTLTQGRPAVVSYVFSDDDNDSESGSQVQWMRNGNPISGATATSYTPQAADAGRQISVQITPATDPARTDPSIGAPVVSAALAVSPPALIDRFLKPDTVTRTQNQANTFCSSKGARLPTSSELQQLFVEATRSPAFEPNIGYIANIEMCSVHSWPLSNACGGAGGADYYKTSVMISSGVYEVVSMVSGRKTSTGNTSLQLTACIR